MLSLSARRVWIEIDASAILGMNPYSHSLRGECGLKFVRCRSRAPAHKSLSARRVWIEIGLKTVARSGPEASLSARRVWIEILIIRFGLTVSSRHSLRGECGLKSLWLPSSLCMLCHSLRGECGLKFGLAKPHHLSIVVTLCEESVD